MKLFSWIRRKPKPTIDEAVESWFEKQIKLRQQGWIYWCETPPLGLDAVYARRTMTETIEIIAPKQLSPYFNIANLWWMPHRYEIDINKPLLMN